MDKDKIIVTVVGKDKVGIIARICTYLADAGVNILNISQTIVDGVFNMMMIADISGANVTFDEMQKALEALGLEIGVQIKAQREEIFEKMHRL